MQADLFGTPPCDPALSQWHTPPWLARRLAEWVWPTARVLEPSAGRGNLIDALRGHDQKLIHAIEMDERWIPVLREMFPKIRLDCGDFFDISKLWIGIPPFDVVLMNPPFENNLHLRFVLRALELAQRVVGIFPASFEFSKERDRELWATRAKVVRRARMPERVDYGGECSPMFDSVALMLERRDAPRRPDETMTVTEEVWTPPPY